MSENNLKDTSVRIMSEMEHIRQRPGMYAGDITQPSTHVKELVDNSLDEMLNGYATRVDINYDLKADEPWYNVRDNGRGLPLHRMPEADNEVAARVLFTRMRAGGKFDHDNYDYSVGLHAVGLKVVNALSTLSIVRVNDKVNKQIYQLKTSEGEVLSEDWIKYDNLEEFGIKDDLWWSTEVYTIPDPKIYSTTKTKIQTLSLELVKDIHKNCEVNINDEALGGFDFQTYIPTKFMGNEPIRIVSQFDTLKMDFQFGWSADEQSAASKGTVNLSPCNDGIHLRNLGTRIGKALQRFEPSLSTKDAGLGLRMFTNLFTSEPSYSSQSKERLTWMNDILTIKTALDRLGMFYDVSTMSKSDLGILSKKLEKLFDNKNKSSEHECLLAEIQETPAFSEVTLEDVLAIGYERRKIVDLFFEKTEDLIYRELKNNEELVEAVIKRIIEYKKSMQMLSEKDFINSVIQKGNSKRSRVSVKGVRDCTSADRTKCEIFLVEGKSAAGNMIKKANRNTQAVMALRGKFLNANTLDSVEDALQNEEMSTLINAIGVGFTPDVELEYARYGKIIIATDADPDGLHISSLILGSLAYACPEIIEAGMVYKSVSPLYKQNGQYFVTDEGLDRSKPYARFKGLGSMDDYEVEESILDPNNRVLIQIELDDAGKLVDIMTSSAERKSIMVRSGHLIEDI